LKKGPEQPLSAISIRIQFLSYTRARPGMSAGGTMMTGQGAHNIVSAAIDPKGPVLALSANSIGAFVEVPMTSASIWAFLASFDISLTTSPSDTLIA
jgi:hypothetical protein